MIGAYAATDAKCETPGGKREVNSFETGSRPNSTRSHNKT